VGSLTTGIMRFAEVRLCGCCCSSAVNEVALHLPANTSRSSCDLSVAPVNCSSRTANRSIELVLPLRPVAVERRSCIAQLQHTTLEPPTPAGDRPNFVKRHAAPKAKAVVQRKCSGCSVCIGTIHTNLESDGADDTAVVKRASSIQYDLGE
jgi:hypothetical protein